MLLRLDPVGPGLDRAGFGARGPMGLETGDLALVFGPPT